MRAQLNEMASLYTAQQLIDGLKLVPNPEGGFFREVYRSGAPPMESQGKTDPRGQTCVATVRVGPDGPTGSESAEKRNTVTSIYYMLTPDSPTQFFVCCNSDIVHYWQSGGRVQYTLVHESGVVEKMTLGPKVLEGDVMQVAVPGMSFKAARLVEGCFALLGVAAAPGFDYVDHFEVNGDILKSRIGGDVDASLLELTKPKAL